MIELTQAQRQVLEMGAPVVPTNTTYLLIRKDVHERIKGMLGDEDWAQDAYHAAMEVFTRDGWDDPRMDVYDGLNPAPDELFTAAQQQQLAELQIRWRATLERSCHPKSRPNWRHSSKPNCAPPASARPHSSASYLGRRLPMSRGPVTDSS